MEFGGVTGLPGKGGTHGIQGAAEPQDKGGTMEFVGLRCPQNKEIPGGWMGGGVSQNPWDKEDPMEFRGSQSHGDGEGHRAPCHGGPPLNLGWSQTG